MQIALSFFKRCIRWIVLRENTNVLKCPLNCGHILVLAPPGARFGVGVVAFFQRRLLQLLSFDRHQTCAGVRTRAHTRTHTNSGGMAPALVARLMRFIVVHRKLLLSILALYVIGLYAIYGTYSTRNNHMRSSGGGLINFIFGQASLGHWMRTHLSYRQTSRYPNLFGDRDGKIIIAIGQ